MVIFRTVLMSTIFILSVSQCFCQSIGDSLVIELEKLLNLDCKEYVDSRELYRNEYHKEPHIDYGSMHIQNCKISPFIEFHNVLNSIMILQDTLLIPIIVNLENQLLVNISAEFEFFGTRYLWGYGECLLKKIYPALLLEQCIKSLELSKIRINGDVKLLISEYVKSANYWSKIKFGIPVLANEEIHFHNKFLEAKKNNVRSFAHFTDFILPFKHSLPDSIWNDELIVIINKLDNITDQYDPNTYKDYISILYSWQIIAGVLILDNSPVIDRIILNNYEVFLDRLGGVTELFRFLPSREIDHTDFLIDLLFDHRWVSNYHENYIIGNYESIFAEGWNKFYPDRTQNTETARNILEQKILEKVKETKIFHRTSNILADRYRDERMAKLLLKIYPILHGKEEQSRIIKLLEKHSPKLNNYSREARKKMDKILKK